MAIQRLRRRQQPADALADLDPMLRWDLESGRSLQELDSLDTMTEVWEIVGGDLLAEWIVNTPGCRPFAWWVCEHRVERPIVGTRFTPEMIQRERDESRFGFLHSSIWAGEWLQMPEWEYLHRAGLLTADELERLPIFDPALPAYKQMGSFRLADVPPVN